MTVTACLWSEGGRTCGYSFQIDGHDFCVSHRPCVSLGFVYDPFRCGVCSPNIEFLKSVGNIDKSCVQYLVIKDSWDAVRRAARRKKLSASWTGESLHDSILGKRGVLLC